MNQPKRWVSLVVGLCLGACGVVERNPGVLDTDASQNTGGAGGGTGSSGGGSSTGGSAASGGNPATGGVGTGGASVDAGNGGASSGGANADAGTGGLGSGGAGTGGVGAGGAGTGGFTLGTGGFTLGTGGVGTGGVGTGGVGTGGVGTGGAQVTCVNLRSITIGNPPPADVQCTDYSSSFQLSQCVSQCQGICDEKPNSATCTDSCAGNPTCQSSGTTWYAVLQCQGCYGPSRCSVLTTRGGSNCFDFDFSTELLLCQVTHPATDWVKCNANLISCLDCP